MNNVAIFSVPRSGSTWLGQIFNSLPNVLYRFQPNFSYSFPHSLNELSDSDAINNFYNELISSTDMFVNGKISISGKGNVEFIKDDVSTLVWKEVHNIYITNILLKHTSTKVIGLVRSPFSVISSWIMIPKEFNPNWSVLKEWREANLKNGESTNNFFGYEKWKEITKLFLELENQFPNQFCLVNYDDLLINTEMEVARIFKFCNLEMQQQTRDFLTQSSGKHDADAYSVFKSKKDDLQWKKTLPQFIIDEISKDPDFIELNKIFHWI